MFKRANKITSLLVAVAAVISIMPTGVSAANLEKIKSEKGEIYNAIAYKDGKFYIEGSPNKKDDEAYYLSNGNYTKLKDINSEDKAEVYGTEYVEVEDGDNYVYLSTGKVTDDKIKEKELDAVSVNLRTKVKSDNDGRYNEDDTKTVKDLTVLPNSKFAAAWYKAEYKSKETGGTVNGGAASLTVYTDKDGKYIDADYNVGKIKVKLSNGKAATVENTSDKDEDVRASVTDTKVIGQDSSNIYRLAKITVKCSTTGVTIKEVNGIEVGTEATNRFVASSDKTSVNFDVIQVISKEQASKEVKGIKYAKNVSSYALSDKDGKKIELLNNAETAFTVTGGKLINYKINGNEIEAQVVNLKSKSSVDYIEKGDNDHVVLQDGQNSVDIDADGNLWALSKDNIYKFDNDEDFEKIYDVDKEYSNISVYNKDNIVVWDADEEVYSIVGKKSTTEDPAVINNNTTPTTPGWVEDSNHKWSYNNADGTKYKSWLLDGGTYYYLDANGIMVTGWQQVPANGPKYYLNEVSGQHGRALGTMLTGWQQIDGTWYYMDGSGAMATNKWIQSGADYYYLTGSGTMATNTTTPDGYKVGASGAWIK